jgi:hypothetical protein
VAGSRIAEDHVDLVVRNVSGRRGLQLPLQRVRRPRGGRGGAGFGCAAAEVVGAALFELPQAAASRQRGSRIKTRFTIST